MEELSEHLARQLLFGHSPVGKPSTNFLSIKVQVGIYVIIVLVSKCKYIISYNSAEVAGINLRTLQSKCMFLLSRIVYVCFFIFTQSLLSSVGYGWNNKSPNRLQNNFMTQQSIQIWRRSDSSRKFVYFA